MTTTLTPFKKETSIKNKIMVPFIVIIIILSSTFILISTYTLSKIMKSNTETTLLSENQLITEKFNNITKEALLKFAISATHSKTDAARFLGLDMGNFSKIYKQYQIEEFFTNETTT